MHGADELLRGRIIVVGADLHKAFEIRHREIALDENGKQTENWKIRALGLKSDIDRRLSLPPPNASHDVIKGNAESIMKSYVDHNAVTTEPARILANLTIAQNLGRGGNYEWQSRFKRLSDEVIELSELSGLGWNIALDYVNKRFVFDIAEGRDLRASQSDNPPVIFAPQFDSLRSMEYVSSDLNYRSVAYVAGAGEGVDRRVVTVGDATGMDRYELFVDARDIQETETIDGVETPIPEAEVIARLTERGRQKLAENAHEEFLSAQILTNSPFKYEVDYDLGDIVTVKNDDWGIGMDTRITEITEIYEAGKPIQIEATFGIGKPTFAEAFRKEFADIRTEIRR